MPGLEFTVDGAGDGCPGVDEAVAIVFGRDRGCMCLADRVDVCDGAKKCR